MLATISRRLVLAYVLNALDLAWVDRYLAISNQMSQEDDLILEEFTHFARLIRKPNLCTR